MDRQANNAQSTGCGGTQFQPCWALRPGATPPTWPQAQEKQDSSRFAFSGASGKYKTACLGGGCADGSAVLRMKDSDTGQRGLNATPVNL